MRYIVEGKTPEYEKTLLDLLSDPEGYTIVDSYEPIEKLSAQVEKVGVMLREFKNSGINWRVFEYYMKGRGVSGTQLKNVMGPLKDFFRNVGIEI